MSTHHRPPRRIRRAPRGQAITEMALGSMVFVSVLALGIYFAEVGFLSLKVQEAATAALWDGTGGKMHTIPLSYESEARSSMRAGASGAAARYADFNGLTSVARPGMELVFTRGSDLRVTCDVGNGPRFAGALLTRPAYRDNDGASCNAEAMLTNINFPRSFMDEGTGGFFNEKNLKERNTRLKVCAVGRPVGMNCPARYTMMVDDWGLTSALESAPCQMIGLGLTTCTNPPFAAATFATYLPISLLVFPRMAGSAMAMGMVGFSPIGLGMASPGIPDEHAFFMSAASEETNFMQVLPMLQPDAEQDNMLPWGTTPGAVVNVSTLPYVLSYGQRLSNGNCFLGKRCTPY